MDQEELSRDSTEFWKKCFGMPQMSADNPLSILSQTWTRNVQEAEEQKTWSMRTTLTTSRDNLMYEID